MSTGAIIGIVVAAVVVVGLLLLVAALVRRTRSGPALRPLDPRAREQFSARWARAQERFVDQPDAALAEAERIVTDVMTERGYPADADHERREADLPRDGREHFRAAHSVLERVPRGASTEDMRAAMVRYRSLFQDLIGDTPARTSH
ncbi:hypothetical protein [Actinokineospora sp. NPDC004072]